MGAERGHQVNEFMGLGSRFVGCVSKKVRLNIPCVYTGRAAGPGPHDETDGIMLVDLMEEHLGAYLVSSLKRRRADVTGASAALYLPKFTRIKTVVHAFIPRSKLLRLTMRVSRVTIGNGILCIGD